MTDITPKAAFPFLWTLFKKDLSKPEGRTSPLEKNSAKQSETSSTIDFRDAQIQAYGSVNYFAEPENLLMTLEPWQRANVYRLVIYYKYKIKTWDSQFLEECESSKDQYERKTFLYKEKVQRIEELQDELFRVINQFDEWASEHEIWIEHFKTMELHLKQAMTMNEVLKDIVKECKDGSGTKGKNGVRGLSSFKDRPRRT